MDEHRDEVEIRHCLDAEFVEAAANLAAGIKKKINVDAVLVEGRPGIYEVLLNGRIIYTNGARSGTPPGTGEVVETIIRNILLEILTEQDDGSGGCSCGCE